jgi:hypothetical protein
MSFKYICRGCEQEISSEQEIKFGAIFCSDECRNQIEQEQERIDKIQREKQQEIIDQFQISEEQRQEMEQEGEMLDPDDFAYPHESQATLKDWKEHIEDFDKDGPTLIIEPNKYSFENNKLVITKEQFPNLTTLYACGLGLEEVEIDCGSLRDLYLTNNQLVTINLEKSSNLVNLLINRNNIKEIFGLEQLTKLEDLRCNANQLKSLNIQKLKNLWMLDASHNRGFDLESSYDDFFNYGIYRLRNFILGDNPNLTILDLGENQIENLDFPFLPNLMMLSLRENNFQRRFVEVREKQSLIMRSPKLIFLDYHVSDIEEWFLAPEYLLENPDQLRICNSKSYTNPDGTFNPDVATPWEDLFNQLHSKRKAKQKGWTKPAPPPAEENSSDQEPIITDPTQLTNDYPELWAKNKDEEELTITTEGLTGTMIFDGFTKLRKINVGNNSLSYLVIKNCPQLHTLRYAYNALRHDAWIDNCPNLTTIDKYGYDGGVAWDNKELPPDGKEKFNQELNTKKSESTESEQNFIKVTKLIKQIESALTQNNLTQASELLTELKELAQKPNSLIQADQLNATIAGLASRLQSQTQLVDSHQKNNWPLIIGSVFIFPITLGIVVLLVKKWVKKRK